MENIAFLIVSAIAAAGAAYILVDMLHSTPIYKKRLLERQLAFWAAFTKHVEAECRDISNELVLYPTGPVHIKGMGPGTHRTLTIYRGHVYMYGSQNLLSVHLTDEGIQLGNKPYAFEDLQDSLGPEAKENSSYLKFMNELKQMVTLDLENSKRGNRK